MSQIILPCWLILAMSGASLGWAGKPHSVLNLWPQKPPGEVKALPPEVDKTKPTDRLIAGRRIIKLGNVSVPQISVFLPPPNRRNGAAVVICPGGGHHILAYDLEGTEVAEWLNTLGVTGIVLKYRVPFRDKKMRWKAAVQDAQRAVSLVRSRASDWQIDPNRLGICGFSAGGETAALTTVFTERRYDAIDSVDQHSSVPNFAMLIYPGGLVDDDNRLHHYVKVTAKTPPMFFVHAFDDRTSVHHSLALAAALKDAGSSAELHIYADGGHGYGLRRTEAPVTNWPERAKSWLRRKGFLKKPAG